MGALGLLGALGAAYVAAGVAAVAGRAGVDPWASWLCVGAVWARWWSTCPRRTVRGQVVALSALLLVLFFLSSGLAGASEGGGGAMDGTGWDPLRGVRIGEAGHPGPPREAAAPPGGGRGAAGVAAAGVGGTAITGVAWGCHDTAFPDLPGGGAYRHPWTPGLTARVRGTDLCQKLKFLARIGIP